MHFKLILLFALFAAVTSSTITVQRVGEIAPLKITEELADEKKTEEIPIVTLQSQKRQLTVQSGSSSTNLSLCDSPCYYTWYNFCYNLWYNMTTTNFTNPNYNFTALCVESTFDTSTWYNYTTPWFNYTAPSVLLTTPNTSMNNITNPCWAIWFNSSTITTIPSTNSTGYFVDTLNTTTGLVSFWFNITDFCNSPCVLANSTTQNLWWNYKGYFQGPCNSSMNGSGNAWLDFSGYWQNDTEGLNSGNVSNPCIYLWYDICYVPWLLSQPIVLAPSPTPQPQSSALSPWSQVGIPYINMSNPSCALWYNVCYNPWFNSSDYNITHPWFNITAFYFNQQNNCSATDVTYYMQLWYNLTDVMYALTKPTNNSWIQQNAVATWMNSISNMSMSWVNLTSNNDTNIYYNFCFNPCLTPCSNVTTNSSSIPANQTIAPNPAPSPATFPSTSNTGPVVSYEDCYNPCYYTWWSLCYALWHNQTYYNTTNPAYNFTTFCNYTSPWTNLTSSNISASDSIIRQYFCWNLWFNTQQLSNGSFLNSSSESLPVILTTQKTTTTTTVTTTNTVLSSGNSTLSNSTQSNATISSNSTMMSNSTNGNSTNNSSSNNSMSNTSSLGSWYNMTSGWRNISEFCNSPCQYGLVWTNNSNNEWSPYTAYFGDVSRCPAYTGVSMVNSSAPWLNYTSPCLDLWLDICYGPWYNESSSAIVSCTNTCYDLWYYACYSPHNQTIFDNTTFASQWFNSSRPWMYNTTNNTCYDPWFNSTSTNGSSTWCIIAQMNPNPFYEVSEFSNYISQCYSTLSKVEILPCLTNGTQLAQNGTNGLGANSPSSGNLVSLNLTIIIGLLFMFLMM